MTEQPAKVVVPLAKGFDPSKHGAQLVAHIEKKYGPGYEITSIDMEKREAYAFKQVALTETKHTTDAIEVKLTAALRKPTAGEQTAAKFEDQNPGYYLVKFEPYLGKAVLAKMHPDEVRCRGAIAEVIGCKPWDVTVQRRRGGGFHFRLPKYTASKHEDKLLEVAEVVVGKPGWFVRIDANKLEGEIIPSEPPTFPGLVPFPASRVKPVNDFTPKGDKERFTIALAEGLGRSGEKNRPVDMDLDDSTAVLLVGLPGSGKLLERSTRLPVPVSERFPSGWALNHELRVGDELYAADGSVTTITGFSEWTTETGYTLHMHDGQTMVVGAGHLHKVSTDHSIGHLGAGLVSKAREFVGTGAVGTLADISRIAGQPLFHVRDKLHHLSTTAYVNSDDAMAWAYCMDDLIEYWRSVNWLNETSYDAVRGRWLTERECAQILPSDIVVDAQRAKARKVRSTGWSEVELYPVDEVLFTAADSGSERIVTTLEMYENPEQPWAIRATEPIQADEADVPLAPWLLGAWLGDGIANEPAIVVGREDHDWLSRAVGHAWPEGRERLEGRWFLTCEGMQVPLRNLGVLGNKHIPALYLRASVEQRMELLRGLMDTDGTVDIDGVCELTLEPELAADALELVRSLGIVAGIKDGVIRFATDAPVVTMPRKAERLRFNGGWNHIERITAGEPVEMRCIKVAHPEHLFLVEGFIPTHNSVAVQSLVVQALIKGYRLAVIDTPAKKSDYSWAKPYVEDHWWGCDDEGTSVAEALTVATLLDEEGKRMGALLNQYRVNKWQELPPDVKKDNPPVLLVADELANLLNKPTVPPGLSKDAKELPQFRQMAQDYLEAKLLTVKLNALVAVHRAAGLREIYVTQRPSKTEGFPPELKSLIPHRVQLGPTPSDADLAMAFRDAKRVGRVPGNIASDTDAARGAGIAHLDGSEPVVIKGFYASNEQFEKILHTYLGPGDPSDSRVRPTAAQIERCVPRADGDTYEDDDDSEKAPSGRSAREVAEQMGDTQALANMDSGLTGFEKANAMRNQAAGGQTRKQREAAKEEARNAARSSDVSSTKMDKCPHCEQGWINPVTRVCTSCQRSA